ncbi:MAG: LysM domain [Verrucomicrobiota bacterium]|jgi:LysM repeat protein
MKFLAAIFLGAFLYVDLSAQTFAPSSTAKPEAAQLEALNKKMDEQNAKIDALSQQILKLQQQLAKPGVPIGEATTPAPAISTSTPNDNANHPAPAGNSHIVARGETLTAIAKMYKVTIDELQKYNHIDNPLRLQAGQTIMIPPSAGANASASPASTPND